MTNGVLPNDETFKASWIASLKSKTQLTNLLLMPGATEIRETQWQGTDFDYPAVRVDLDFMPSIERCGPDDADVKIRVYSAEKSSKQAAHISAIINQLYHGHPFKQLNIMFCTVIVRKIHKPIRSIYAWEQDIDIFCQGF